MEAAKIVEVMEKIQAPKSNLGFKYIIESVKLISEDDAYLYKIMAVYHQVAKVYDSTASRVERAIRHEVEMIFLNVNGNDEELNEVFGAYRNKYKLSNKEFLASLYYYLIYKA